MTDDGVIRGRRLGRWVPARGPPQRRPAQALLQGVQIGVNHGRDIQRDELREGQAADHGDAERAARFRADAHAQRDGQGAHERRHRGHHDRPKPDGARLQDGVVGRLPSLRCASNAKSIIMIPFFFTSPTSMMTPTNAYTLRSTRKIRSVSSAPNPAKGSAERIVSGWMKLSYRMPSTM